MTIQTRQVRQGRRIWDNHRNSGKVRRPLEFSKDSNVIVSFPDVVYVIGRSGRHPDIWMKSRTGHFKCSRLTSSRRDPSAFFCKVWVQSTTCSTRLQVVDIHELERNYKLFTIILDLVPSLMGVFSLRDCVTTARKLYLCG